jgi:hypothetical protein
MIELIVTATVLWNCTNIHTTPHPIPVSFQSVENGYEAVLEDGSVFRQRWLSENGEIMKVEWQDAYWWLDSRGNIVWGTNEVGAVPMASDDMTAVSILLSK